MGGHSRLRAPRRNQPARPGARGDPPPSPEWRPGGDVSGRGGPASARGTDADGATVCAGAASTEAKTNAAASIGSLVRPKPVVNSIVLPATTSTPKMRRYRCKIVAACGGAQGPSCRSGARMGLRPCSEFRTNGPREPRAPESQAQRKQHLAGLEARTRSARALPSVPRETGPVGVPPHPTLVILGR